MPTGVVQTKRRTWDEELYRKKAEERAQRESDAKKPIGDFRTPLFDVRDYRFLNFEFSDVD